MATGTSALTTQDYWTEYNRLNALEPGMNSLSGCSLDRLYRAVVALKDRISVLQTVDEGLKTKVNDLFTRVADKTEKKDACEKAIAIHMNWVFSGGGF